MNPCPKFECLAFSMAACEKYPACEGCEKQYDCNSCSNQSTLVENGVVACDMISIPSACRFCAARNAPNFSPDTSCGGCPVRT